MWSQCLAYQGELDGGFVADGELVIASRDAAGLLQESVPALGLVPALVHLAVEGRQPSSGAAASEAVAGLVALLRDGVRDLAAAQVLADRAGGVRPVGENVARADTRASAALPGNTDAVHDPAEHWGVGPLTGGDHGRQDVEGGVDGEVELGGQAAARASDRVVVRLCCQPVGTRLARIGSPFAGPGGVLVGPTDRGVDGDLPTRCAQPSAL